MLRGEHYLGKVYRVIRFFVCSASILLDMSFRAKLSDFGQACALKEDGSTQAHTVMETSGYFPPEYYRGEITTRMDTYSFGVVCVWCDSDSGSCSHTEKL